MNDAFCLTINEASEITGLEVAEILEIASNNPGVALQVKTGMRVAPDALRAVMSGTELAQAA
jgi:hypothetical protein